MWLQKKAHGELTAFLAILFVLLAGFICSVVKVAALHEEKCYRRTDMDLAMYSLFGEYQKDLLEEYHVFGMDAGYESGNYSEEAVLGRLRYYGANSMDLEITDIQFLTDNAGSAFYEQVLFYMETKYGISLIQEFTGLTDDWEEQMVQGEEYFQEKEDVVGGLLQTLEAEELENSIAELQDASSSDFLKKVLPTDFVLSSQAFHLAEMPSRRALNRGFGSFQQRDLSGLTNRLLFGEYLLQNFSNACKENKSGGMAYELEYVIAGKGSDKENLESVAKKLALLRFVADYAYLQTDEVKQAEAQATALAISTALLSPQITEVVKQAVILLWAYEESIEDVKTLLSGGSIPLIKSASQWQSAIDLEGTGTELVVRESRGAEESAEENGVGMKYEDYLRILLFLTKRETCAMRSLDVIEYGLRVGKNLTFFRTDLCISKLCVKSTAVIGQGITYDFTTEFIYE